MILKTDKVFTLFLCFLTLTPVYCIWPICHITSTGHCSYNVECIQVLDNFRPPNECLGSSNYNKTIALTVREASDTFDRDADKDVLQSVTTLTVIGDWSETSLPFLQTMFQLKTLNAIYSKIKHISGSPFASLSLIEDINLSHNALLDITEVFQYGPNPNRVKTLILSYNFIRKLPNETFADLIGLVELDLSYNFITELSDEPFEKLTNLVTLRLNNNKITDLNGALYKLINLKHLHLRFNEINNIDEESMNTVIHLVTFDISKNQLENLNPILFSRHWNHFNDQSTSYCRIILSGNQIVLVPNTTSAEPDLPGYTRQIRNEGIKFKHISTELNLSNNSISEIQYNAFQSIKYLTALDLSNNKLFSFVVNSEHLENMMYLNLSCNLLSRLDPSSFYSMHGLQNLDLSYNYLDYFPSGSTIGSDSLKRLNFTNNHILDIHSLKITFDSSGGVLDLSNNGLSTLEVPMDEAYGLQELILTYNNITDPYLIQLNSQRQLLRLNMSKNYIKELDKYSLQLPVSLIYFDLSANMITKIGPSSFQKIGHLKTLKLSHNYLTDVEFGAFNGLVSLMTLDLSFNNIQFLNSKLFLDLKSLRFLSLRHNGLNYMDHNSWLSHKYDLLVYLDGNDYSCDWLADALSDYSSGYSKMRPTALENSVTDHTIDDIPCKQEDNRIMGSGNYVMSDERLLATSQKILEVVREQTTYLRKLLSENNANR